MVDNSRHTYTFVGDVRLSAGRYVRIHTGRGTNTSLDRYWGSTAYIWNNSGDAAFLHNSTRILIDSCSWGSSGSYTYC